METSLLQGTVENHYAGAGDHKRAGDWHKARHSIKPPARLDQSTSENKGEPYCGQRARESQAESDDQQ